MASCSSLLFMMTAVRAGFQRAEIVAALGEALGERRWAWQGASEAVAEWTAADDAKDLDIWCDDADAAPVRLSVAQALPVACIEHADDPRRLRHTGWAVESNTGLAIVDVTFGDLRVGPVLLLTQADIEVTDHRLVGAAAAADLFVRPLLRGRIVAQPRLDQARAAWRDAGDTQRAAAIHTWRASLPGMVDDIVAVLEGGEASSDLVGRARMILIRRTLAPRNLTSTWRQRRSILPAGRRKGPLGHRTEGVVVATVGTDGSGKSTVADDARTRLEAIGMPTRTAYFGMARGNLPGVGLARKVLGIKAPGGEDHSGDVVEEAAHDMPEAIDKPLDHQGLRRIAAWFYAVEYGWRYLSTVAGPKRRGEVVICDRYVYDLRDSPWPGSRASVFAEWLVPAPDVMVLPDAPVEMIHARKPERPFAEQRAQQEKFRALLAEQPGRSANLVVDTSGATADAVGPLVRAIVSAAHLDPNQRP
jgi:thymidylate kinase